MWPGSWGGLPATLTNGPGPPCPPRSRGSPTSSVRTVTGRAVSTTSVRTAEHHLTTLARASAPSAMTRSLHVKNLEWPPAATPWPCARSAPTASAATRAGLYRPDETTRPPSAWSTPGSTAPSATSRTARPIRTRCAAARRHPHGHSRARRRHRGHQRRHRQAVHAVPHLATRRGHLRRGAGQLALGPHHGPQTDMLAGANAITTARDPNSGHLAAVKDSAPPAYAGPA